MGKYLQGRAGVFWKWPLQTVKVIMEDNLGAIGLILVLFFVGMAHPGPLCGTLWPL
jgi:hypothetical protein